MACLTLEQEKSIDEANAAAKDFTCSKCKQQIRKGFCGRCDLVTYTCGCPFEPDPNNSWHIDHSKCRSR